MVGSSQRFGSFSGLSPATAGAKAPLPKVILGSPACGSRGQKEPPAGRPCCGNGDAVYHAEIANRRPNLRQALHRHAEKVGSTGSHCGCEIHQEGARGRGHVGGERPASRSRKKASLVPSRSRPSRPKHLGFVDVVEIQRNFAAEK